jgi:hypothetical protein
MQARCAIFRGVCKRRACALMNVSRAEFVLRIEGARVGRTASLKCLTSAVAGRLPKIRTYTGVDLCVRTALSSNRPLRR